LQVAKQSVREVIFDVGHHEAVKIKLRALLQSEIVPVSEMQHDSILAAKNIEDEGDLIITKRSHDMLSHFTFMQCVATLGIGWTFNVTTHRASVRKAELVLLWQKLKVTCLCWNYLFDSINLQSILHKGLATVKYIYGAANAGPALDAVIGSSISGRLESKIGIGRLTTIAMPMRGKQYNYGIIHVRHNDL
jgi:hypothetical protein